jgi:hypothetical protein
MSGRIARVAELPDRATSLLVKREAQMPHFDGAAYARVTPGRYQAAATRVIGPQLVLKYKRWSVGIEFSLISEDARLMAFFNLGSGEKPNAPRGSRYFRAWTLANGEMPYRGQALDPAIFLDDQVFEVAVDDCGRDEAREEKADSLVYSMVREVISAERARTGRSQDSPGQGEGHANPKSDHKGGEVKQLPRSGQPKREVEI